MQTHDAVRLAGFQAAHAMDKFVYVMNQMVDRARADLSPAQREHYDKLVAEGEYIMDALRDARLLK